MDRKWPGSTVLEQDPDGVINFRHDGWSQDTKMLIVVASWDFGGKSLIRVLVVANFLVDFAQIWPVRPCEDEANAVRTRDRE